MKAPALLHAPGFRESGLAVIHVRASLFAVVAQIMVYVYARASIAASPTSAVRSMVTLLTWACAR